LASLSKLFMCAAIALPLTASAEGFATAHVTVSVSVSESCAFDLGGDRLPFDTANPAVTIRARCTTGYTQKVFIDQGLHPGAGSTDEAPVRQMARGTSRAPYNVYTTAARDTVWGNTSATSVPLTGQGTDTNLVLYGRTSVGRKVTKGSYADTVVMTFAG
jgi:spore coat protein U-like protein